MQCNFWRLECHVSNHRLPVFHMVIETLRGQFEAFPCTFARDKLEGWPKEDCEG